jgi:hypothetical protein
MDVTTNITDIQVTSVSSKTAEVKFFVEPDTISALQITKSQSTAATSAIIAEDKSASRLQEAMRVMREEEEEEVEVEAATSIASPPSAEPKAARKKEKKVKSNYNY